MVRTSPSSTDSTIPKSTEQKLNIQLLMKIQGDKAKTWSNASIAFQAGIIAVSAYSTLTENLVTESTSVIIPFVSILVPFIQWRADRLKSNYQSILQKFEFLDSLGWEITPREKSDWLVPLTKKQRKEVTALNRTPQHYFASKKKPSSRRLLENLEESSWWSKELAKFAASVIGIFTMFVILTSIGLLLISIFVAVNQATLVNIAKVITSVLAAVFSIGFVRLSCEYWEFAQFSAKTEKTTSEILDKSKEPKEAEASKLLHEYQIARSNAPMLPNWAWKLNQKKLNVIWNQYRCRD